MAQAFEGVPTHFAIINKQVFTQKFKLIKICIKFVYFVKKMQKFSKRYKGTSPKPPLTSDG